MGTYSGIVGQILWEFGANTVIFWANTVVFEANIVVVWVNAVVFESNTEVWGQIQWYFG